MGGKKRSEGKGESRSACYNDPMAKSKKIHFRSYPKIVFAWPVALGALGAGAATIVRPERMNQIGLVFAAVALVNLAVLAFEFSRGRTMTVALGAMGLGSTLVLLNQRYPIFRPLHLWMGQRQIHASAEFYFMLASGFGAVFVGIFLKSRFDYWTLTASELVHRRGFLGESERFSTSGLKLRKEITDVLEYLVLGAGRVVLSIPGQAYPIVLDNVLGCQRVERFAEEVLDARIVRIEQDLPAQRSA